MVDSEFYGLSDIIIVSAFFLMWNTAICLPTVKALSNLLHGECPATPILICPHWIVGIALPVVFGRNSALGSMGIFLSCLSFALPYTVGVYIELYDRWTSTDTQQRLWLAAGASSNANYMSLSQTNDSTTTPEETNTDLQSMNSQEREKYLNEILLTRKVISESKGQEQDIQVNYYETDIIYQEKIDIITPRSSRDNLCPAAENNNVICEEQSPLEIQNATTPSPISPKKPERVCSICLDEYVIGEEVCWSQNPNCYHAFHKSCIMAWLMKHKDCPVCRRLYIGTFSDEEMGTN